MKHVIVTLLAATAAWGQVAAEVNRRYESEQGRQQMIQTLGSPNRPEQLQAEKLVAELELKTGATVVDLGTGAGMLLPYLSAAVGPSGKVIAEDIHRDFVRAAEELVQSKGLANVEFVIGTDRDPKLPAANVDLVVAVDAYHHFDYPAEMLGAIRSALKPGGRLVIVDYYKSGFRDPAHIRLDKLDVVKEVASNGFRLLKNEEHIEGQYRLEFVSDR